MTETDTGTLTREAYDELLARIEDLAASLALERARQHDDGTRIPLAVVKAEIAGSHPIAAWRAYRSLSVQQLAEQAHVPAEAITAVEADTATPDSDFRARIAAALDAPADVLEPPANAAERTNA